MEELMRVIPRIVMLVAPPAYLREELGQQLLCDCWQATRENRSAIRSLFDYVKRAAPRTLRMLFGRDHAGQLVFDDDALASRASLQKEDDATRTVDVESFRAALMDLLTERQLLVYENRYVHQLTIRKTATACGMDTRQVQRIQDQIEAVARKLASVHGRPLVTCCGVAPRGQLQLPRSDGDGR